MTVGIAPLRLLRKSLSHLSDVEILQIIILAESHVKQKVLRKIGDPGKAFRAGRLEAGVVPERQYSRTGSLGFGRQPHLWPEEIWVPVLRPCLSTGTSKSMDKDNVGGPRESGVVDDIEA